jgi:hypothetical protein
MSYLSSKQVQDINSLYESIYTEVLTEEQQNELLMVEWHNIMVEEGMITGDAINSRESLDEGVWDKLGQGVAKYGPKAVELLKKAGSKITGFGLGKDVGQKRRLTTGIVGGATITNPEKAADIALRTGSGIAGAATGAVQGGVEGVKKGGLKKDETMRGF